MPQAVLLAALPAVIGGAAQAVSTVVGSRAQSNAAKRATTAQQQAAARAEAHEREQAAREDARLDRIEAEDRRRHDIEQANIARQQAERDSRQAYEDDIRYTKMVRLAELTGGPRPNRPPVFGTGAPSASVPLASTYAPPNAPIMARPSTANQMIAAAPPFDPFTDAAMPPPGVPLRALNRRRPSYVA
jgi:hypothetical protein